MALHQEPKDLGFGSVVATESRVRLMNRDGSFNVLRSSRLAAVIGSPYHYLLTMSWPAFLSVLGCLYLVINVLFAFVFLICGSRALGEPDGAFVDGSFLQAFFFSVQTFATIGYGQIVPMKLNSNSAVIVESFTSLICIGLSTGLIFSRFSRPSPHIRFSRSALIAPYRGGAGFMFRIANARRNEIVGVEATVIFSRFETVGGIRTRTFKELALERKRVIFFSLPWTIVHPVDETSPLLGMSSEDLVESEAEFLILLSGTDETFFQTVSARGSYTAAELRWGYKFRTIFLPPTPEGMVRVDLKRLDDTEPAAVAIPNGRPAVAAAGSGSVDPALRPR